MADLNAIDRLQPCLLDRLFDDEPRRLSEAKHEKVISLARFKDGIKRDIEWILNSKTRFDWLDESEFGLVKRSVLNYGLRDFTGLSSENLEAGAIQRLIEQALLTFEPRILPESLKVRHVTAVGRHANLKQVNHLDFEITGKLWAEPLPQDFALRTEMLLEEGSIVLN
ncbi:MAG: type VI secretion system baseplate subunit TssE [Opitutaceae bacterium]